MAATAIAATAAYQRALTVLKKYPKKPLVKYSYGTAGFRFEIDNFADAIFVRAGMLACARAQKLAKNIGLCITASHNPVKDNGVKIIDPDGGMLAEEWEKIAFEVANAETEERCLEILIHAAFGNDNSSPQVSKDSKVLLGRDTRPHSEHLENIALEGIEAFFGGLSSSFGVVTTPQLHFCVMRSNLYGYNTEFDATLKGYKNCLVNSYKALVEGTAPCSSEIFVDCANGVGAVMFPEISEELKTSSFRCALFNTNTLNFDKLNEGCGAEHVQKLQIPPLEISPNPEALADRYASFDGDADRIVFYYFTKKSDIKSFRLLDGDKIASLIALFVKEQTKLIFLQNERVTIGAVQTAYANGSSSNYLKNFLHVDAPFVKTGVKHLHHKALEYDIGIYFEANGHGTALFRPSFVEMLKSHPVKSDEAKLAKKRLLALANLFNQATGDAFSDLLAVDAMLRVLSFDEAKWNALYADLPSRQLKVKVVDRSQVLTTQDETRCIRPQALQAKLDHAVSTQKQGRVFVRPSGTEDVVRVYAEAETQEGADKLAEEAVQAIIDEAGGLPESKRMKPSS
jgi:phosphoacetylglucosamine mutase